jgi:hypothetical protein
MDNRQKLIGILKAASEVLAPAPAMAADLHTMVAALENVDAAKFDQMVDPKALEAMTLEPEQPTAAAIPNQEPPMAQPAAPTASIDALSGWNDKAASAVRAKLAKDVCGCDLSSEVPGGVPAAKLPAEQLPNGEHSVGAVTGIPGQVSGAALPKEQQPNEAVSLKSDMVAKSEGPVSKEATAEIPEEDKTVEAAAEAKPESNGIALPPSNEVEAAELGSLFN